MDSNELIIFRYFYKLIDLFFSVGSLNSTDVNHAGNIGNAQFQNFNSFGGRSLVCTLYSYRSAIICSSANSIGSPPL